MYDLKQCNNNEKESEKEEREKYITERSYYKDRLSNSILNTKSAYVPHDDLF